MPSLGDYFAGNIQAGLTGQMGFSPEQLETERNRFKRQLNRQYFGSPTGETLGEFARANRGLAARGLTAGGAPDAKNVALASNMMEQERIFEEGLAIKDLEERLRQRQFWAGQVPTLDSMARANLSLQDQLLLNRYRTQEDIFARLFGLQEDASRNRLLDFLGGSNQMVGQTAQGLTNQFMRYLQSILGSFAFGGAAGADRGGIGMGDILGAFF